MLQDDKLGQIQINLAKYKHGQRTDFWLPLEDAPGKKGSAQGEIRVGVTVTPVPDDDERALGLNKEVSLCPCLLPILRFFWFRSDGYAI
jgi:hypothetical protein